MNGDSQKSQNSKLTQGSSKRTVTRSLLSKYFKKDQKSQIESGILTKNQRPKSVDRAASKQKVIIKREGRYAASKASSIVGFMLAGKKAIKPI